MTFKFSFWPFNAGMWAFSDFSPEKCFEAVQSVGADNLRELFQV